MNSETNMQENNAFLSGPSLPPLRRFALPLMLSLFLQALYGGVDLAVVGHYSPTASVSAVATGSQAMQVLTGLISGLTMSLTFFFFMYLSFRPAQKTQPPRPGKASAETSAPCE